MMIPEPWQNHEGMSPARRAFYEYHSSLMEPWDGPASIAFTDGTVIGAILDRNGLRPSRYYVTKDDLVIMASEVGVLDIPPRTSCVKERLHPGPDLPRRYGAGPHHRRRRDQGAARRGVPLRRVARSSTSSPSKTCRMRRSCRRPIIRPCCAASRRSATRRKTCRCSSRTWRGPAKSRSGSMGTDTPLAALSERPRLLYDYFKQLFAQVTNPPLDAIREELVTSMESTIGPERNLLLPEPESCRQINVRYPIIDNDQLAKLRHIQDHGQFDGFRSVTLPMIYDPREGGAALERAMERLQAQASAAVRAGNTILILSDRGVTEKCAPIPSLLATAGVHHHLVREGTRTRCALLLESGDAREVHHVALLIGYGAGAVNPYLAFETLDDMIAQGIVEGVTREKATLNYIKALNKGILKVMSKMGISTLQSYCGAQIFEAIGLEQAFVDRYFTWTASRIGGVGIDVIASEVKQRHERAFPTRLPAATDLESGGEYRWRRDGELHLFNPETVQKLQHATRTGQYSVYREFTEVVNDQSRDARHAARPARLQVRAGAGAARGGRARRSDPQALRDRRDVVRLDQPGSARDDRHRHESPRRQVEHRRRRRRSRALSAATPNGDSRRSAIKQVASARFGVTSEYLVNADDLQIKMAQGAKPGEGGQLPGHKVYPWIAKVRHSTPGVTLISPPPHHDIYSIEDLAQLIHDLKNANPAARVHVKLVAEVGVGTVAAGVSKAHADVVLISGHDGGTGASPLTSIKHAGIPWELGLAETQQVLLLNRLRDRIVVQVDGQLKTGRDVVIAALLGAEEFGFATAALVVSGCIMMRVCHLNTCPVGIATQDPELRKKFNGKPEFVENYFRFVAEDVRELMARLGFRTMNEMIGRADRLESKPARRPLEGERRRPLADPLPAGSAGRHVAPRRVRTQDHGLERALDVELIARAVARTRGAESRSTSHMPIRNVNRTVGTMLGYEITRRYGGAGLPDDTIRIHFTGSAGQSFGAFVPRGVTMRLEGDSNDYCGKGLSGGKIAVYPPRAATFAAEENVIIGNVALYGATSGEAYVRGIAGERFAVRNSGALAVVEGVGDHACEYMTGGPRARPRPDRPQLRRGHERRRRLCLRPGDNFRSRCNREMVELESLAESTTIRRSSRCSAMLRNHVRFTGSTVAAGLLADWDAVQGTVRQGDPARLQAGDAGRGARARGIARAGVQRARRSRRQWVRPPGSSRSSGRSRRPARSGARPGLAGSVSARARAKMRDQGARCMDCGIPFCHQGCPLGNVIPDWNDLVYHQRWQAASDRLHATNNFPEWTGRLCPAPCEGSCVLGINDDPVTIKSIELSIVEHAFEHGWIQARPPALRTGKRVAVVGSGPAGLAAADELNKAGHHVTVFERADRIGGLLRYGIPEFKLEKRFIDRRLALMSEEGVEFRTGVEIGIDLPVAGLRRQFDAIVLCCGTPGRAICQIPGRELAGVHFAVEYLTQQNRRLAGDHVAPADVISAEGKRVVIIGGGDTGADCLGTVHRQGALSVHQFELLERPPDVRHADNPWPQWPNVFRTSPAHEEGGERVYAVSTERFLGDPQGRIRRAAGGQCRDPPRGRADAGHARRRHRVRARGGPGAARHGLPRSRARQPAVAAGGQADRPRERLARRRVDDLGAGRLHRRRHAAGTVAHRVGDRRRPERRAVRSTVF